MHTTSRHPLVAAKPSTISVTPHAAVDASLAGMGLRNQAAPFGRAQDYQQPIVRKEVTRIPRTDGGYDEETRWVAASDRAAPPAGAPATPTPRLTSMPQAVEDALLQAYTKRERVALLHPSPSGKMQTVAFVEFNTNFGFVVMPANEKMSLTLRYDREAPVKISHGELGLMRYHLTVAVAGGNAAGGLEWRFDVNQFNKLLQEKRLRAYTTPEIFDCLGPSCLKIPQAPRAVYEAFAEAKQNGRAENGVTIRYTQLPLSYYRDNDNGTFTLGGLSSSVLVFSPSRLLDPHGAMRVYERTDEYVIFMSSIHDSAPEVFWLRRPPNVIPSTQMTARRLNDFKLAMTSTTMTLPLSAAYGTTEATLHYNATLGFLITPALAGEPITLRTGSGEEILVGPGELGILSSDIVSVQIGKQEPWNYDFDCVVRECSGRLRVPMANRKDLPKKIPTVVLSEDAARQIETESARNHGANITIQDITLCIFSDPTNQRLLIKNDPKNPSPIQVFANTNLAVTLDDKWHEAGRDNLILLQNGTAAPIAVWVREPQLPARPELATFPDETHRAAFERARNERCIVPSRLGDTLVWVAYDDHFGYVLRHRESDSVTLHSAQGEKSFAKPDLFYAIQDGSVLNMTTGLWRFSTADLNLPDAGQPKANSNGIGFVNMSESLVDSFAQAIQDGQSVTNDGFHLKICYRRSEFVISGIGFSDLIIKRGQFSVLRLRNLYITTLSNIVFDWEAIELAYRKHKGEPIGPYQRADVKRKRPLPVENSPEFRQVLEDLAILGLTEIDRQKLETLTYKDLRSARGKFLRKEGVAGGLTVGTTDGKSTPPERKVDMKVLTEQTHDALKRLETYFPKQNPRPNPEAFNDQEAHTQLTAALATLGLAFDATTTPISPETVYARFEAEYDAATNLDRKQTLVAAANLVLGYDLMQP